MGQSDYIVFLCYGYERVFHECAYALLSLSRIHKIEELKNTEIWIYTDKPEWFKEFKDCPLPLNYRQVDEATIKNLRGTIDFVHRVKIEVLKDITCTKEGNILYVDTDVVFANRIEKIFEDIAAGKLYMHIRESKVSDKANPILCKLSNYIEGAQLKLNGKPLNEMDMWNAGVLGFNTRHKQILEEVLTFTDREYPKFPKHVVEQFAFSVYFQDKDDIKAASPYLFHYWNLKEAGSVLSSFFHHFKNKSWQELVHYSALIQMENLMQEKLVFYSNRRISGIIAGKKWEPHSYNWQELMKQL
ncbi:MAG: hypothetical protein K0Q79_1957 [Flavipsychrobacter sp.]|jgi:hypothetical protein|nr:hypothetical protein [Flavipsychrobacter sp.]